jgi:hypothetical protein
MEKEMLETACEEARRKLTDQLNTVDSIDQKIGVILGFAGVILAILFNKTPIGFVPSILYSIGQGCVVISIGVLFLGYRSVMLKTGLNIKGYQEIIKERRKDGNLILFLRTVLAYLNKAIKTNNVLMRRKNIKLAIGSILLLIGVAFFVVSFVYSAN